MEIQDIRRSRLREYIRKNFPLHGSDKGNVSAFASSVGKPQSQIADMLDRRKSFGEKVARKLEEAVLARGLEPLDLEGSARNSSKGTSEVRERSPADYQVSFSESARLFAAEWEKMPEPAKSHLEAFVYSIVGHKVRKKRRKKSQEDRPRPNA